MVNSRAGRRIRARPIGGYFGTRAGKKVILVRQGVNIAAALVILGFGALPGEVIFGNGKGNIRRSARFW